MKLINLLIRELKHCSSGGEFRVWCHSEICQFDRFSSEINFKRARSCNYGIPRLGLSWNENTINDIIVCYKFVFLLHPGNVLSFSHQENILHEKFFSTSISKNFLILIKTVYNKFYSLATIKASWRHSPETFGSTVCTISNFGSKFQDGWRWRGLQWRDLWLVGA